MPAAVEVGDEPDHESATAKLCYACTIAALATFNRAASCTIQQEDPTCHPGCENERGADGRHWAQFCIFCLRKIGDDAQHRLAELEAAAHELRSWAKTRITSCHEQELKFGAAWQIGNRHGPPQALVEAWTERRTLQDVLRMLDLDPTSA